MAMLINRVLYRKQGKPYKFKVLSYSAQLSYLYMSGPNRKQLSNMSHATMFYL